MRGRGRFEESHRAHRDDDLPRRRSRAVFTHDRARVHMFQRISAESTRKAILRHVQRVWTGDYAQAPRARNRGFVCRS